MFNSLNFLLGVFLGRDLEAPEKASLGLLSSLTEVPGAPLLAKPVCDKLKEQAAKIKQQEDIIKEQEETIKRQQYKIKRQGNRIKLMAVILFIAIVILLLFIVF